MKFFIFSWSLHIFFMLINFSILEAEESIKVEKKKKVVKKKKSGINEGWFDHQKSLKNKLLNFCFNLGEFFCCYFERFSSAMLVIPTSFYSLCVFSFKNFLTCKMVTEFEKSSVRHLKTVFRDSFDLFITKICLNVCDPSIFSWRWIWIQK